MTDDRRQHLRALLTTNGHADVRVDRICDACVTTLDISGASVTVLSKAVGGRAGEHHRGLVHASDPVSAGLEELQLAVGEGPCMDTFATGGPILVPDLAADLARWPAFGPGAADLGAAAVFSFPPQVGVVRLGSFDLYRDRPGALILFALRCSFSGKSVHRAFASGGQEAFFEGHEHAFRDLGGVPAGQIRYDNLKAAVAQVTGSPGSGSRPTGGSLSGLTGVSSRSTASPA
ncbi:hypothetical protein M8542_49070 [Amycolatopsis sp. OK19-0408]|uniref:Uncharacterized protein n=1 Tax=Amycolatopsis iheyensis TaxID=2945988 RepID=A0A9X2NL01_9PSEU|nr:GAF domain-containing protein [Amycolatopsis iheyensis]MCR6490771.1 hypothetical protein [Amycolatopsis iheyensis]